METLNRPIVRRWIGNPNFPKQKSPGPDDFTGKVYQTFEDKSMPNPQTLPKTEEERTLPNSFYEAKITLTPKPDKDTSKDQYPWWIYRQKFSTKY